MPISRTEYARPTYRLHDFSSTAIAEDQSSTEVTEIDMGTVAASSDSNVKALTVKFDDDFDDTVYENVRVWMLNVPHNLASHTWNVQFESQFTFGAAADTTLASGVEIGKNPFDATKKHATTDSVYDSTGKQIETIALQLSAGASPDSWNQANELVLDPVLVAEFQRRDSANTKVRTDYSMTDVEEGYLFTFSDVNLYEVLEDSSSNKHWHHVGSIQESSFSIDQAEESAEWRKSKPSVKFHEVISSVKTDVTFRLDQCDPRWIARALHTSPSENTTDNTVDVEVNGLSRAAVTGEYYIEWFTIGGHIVRLHIPKATVYATGAMTPGADEIGGTEFMLTGQATSPNRTISTTKISRTPVEQVFLGVDYEVS